MKVFVSLFALLCLQTPVLSATQLAPKAPCVKGLIDNSPTGNLDHLLHLIAKQYGILQTRDNRMVPYGTVQMQFLHGLFTRITTQLSLMSESAALPQEFRDLFSRYLTPFRGWTEVLKQELHLRAAHHVTLCNQGKLTLDLVANRENPQRMNALIEKALETQKFKSDPPIMARFNALESSRWLAGNSLQEFDAHFRAIAEQSLTDNLGLANLRVLYAVRRTLLIGVEASRKEGVFALIDEDFAPKRRESGARQTLVEEIAEILNRTMSERAAQLPTALQILNLTKVRQGFQTVYVVQFPKGPITFESYLRTYPPTAAAYKPIPVEDIPAASWKFLRHFHSNPSRFQEALNRARMNETQPGRFKVQGQEILTPMNGGAKIYDLMRVKMIFGEPRHIWEHCGLFREYNARFPTDQDFWNSPLSLAEIYALLEADRKAAGE